MENLFFFFSQQHKVTPSESLGKRPTGHMFFPALFFKPVEFPLDKPKKPSPLRWDFFPSRISDLSLTTRIWASWGPPPPPRKQSPPPTDKRSLLRPVNDPPIIVLSPTLRDRFFFPRASASDGGPLPPQNRVPAGFPPPPQTSHHHRLGRAAFPCVIALLSLQRTHLLHICGRSPPGSQLET